MKLCSSVAVYSQLRGGEEVMVVAELVPAGSTWWQSRDKTGGLSLSLSLDPRKLIRLADFASDICSPRAELYNTEL